MYLVVVYGWEIEEVEVAKAVADTLSILLFEARQKIAGGGPRVLATFADALPAETLAARLSEAGVPALSVDPVSVRSGTPPFSVRRFVLGPEALELESNAGDACRIDYGTIDLLLAANCSAGQTQTTHTTTERKFSLGKTLLSGGLPMTKKVTTEETLTSIERDETLWLYARERGAVVFNRGALDYSGLGDAMQLTRDLNFNRFKTSLRGLAPQARYDDRLLKRAEQVRLIGPSLNPDTDIDLAFEILFRTLLPQPGDSGS
jgi:hypothetical protein